MRQEPLTDHEFAAIVRKLVEAVNNEEALNSIKLFVLPPEPEDAKADDVEAGGHIVHPEDFGD